MSENDIFYPIKGFEGYFEINKNGVIKSIDREYLNNKGVKMFFKGTIKKSKKNYGYVLVNLQVAELGIRRDYRIHRLLAETFIPNPENHPVINHKNGIRDDNRLENIEWVSVQYNNWHTYSRGRLMHNRSLSYDDVFDIYHNTKITKNKYNRPGNLSAIEMAEKYNVTKRTIMKILHKLTYLEIVNTFEDISWYGNNILK